MEKVCASSLAGGEIVLAPFTVDSILLYHRLKRDGFSVWGFFDANPQLWDRVYDGVTVFRPYDRGRGVYVISSELYMRDIAEQYAAMGIERESILDAASVVLKTPAEDAAWDADISAYTAMVPQAWDGDIWVERLGEYREVVRREEPLQGSGGIARIKRLKRMSEIWKENREWGVFLKRFEFHVTEECSLRCRHCGGLTAYFESPRAFDLAAMKRDYDAFIGAIDFSDDILIMGGEPFLHPELPAFLRHVHAHPLTEERIGYLRLITNGTLLPPSELLHAVRETGTTLWISNYREKSGRLNELVRLLHDAGVIYRVLNIPHWSLVQQLEDGENVSVSELREKLRRCMHRHRVVKDGKFFRCAFLAAGSVLCCFPQNPANCLDIHAERYIVGDIKSGIAGYLSGEHLVPGCAWCREDSLEHWNNDIIPAAEQAERPLAYKRYE